MKAFQILETKNFMSRLLLSDCFDRFLLAEASITTYNTFVIDGHIVSEFYQGNNISADAAPSSYSFSEWKDMRSICFDLIKGKHTPVNFRFTLYLKPEFMEKLLSESGNTLSAKNVQSFVVNIKYQNGMVSLITATSYQSFISDKTLDVLWDHHFQSFLTAQKIDFDEII